MERNSSSAECLSSSAILAAPILSHPFRWLTADPVDEPEIGPNKCSLIGSICVCIQLTMFLGCSPLGDPLSSVSFLSLWTDALGFVSGILDGVQSIVYTVSSCYVRTTQGDARGWFSELRINQPVNCLRDACQSITS